MGHVRDTSETFVRKPPAQSGGQGAHPRFSSDQIADLVERGLLHPDARFELILGEIVMSSAESAKHALTKARISRALCAWVLDMDVGQNVSLQLSSESIVDPDVLVWRPGIHGTFFQAHQAVLAIEVSLSRLRHDLEVKPALYAESGVPEIWVVDVEGEVTHVFSDPQQSVYRRMLTYAFTDPIPLALAPAGVLVIADLLG